MQVGDLVTYEGVNWFILNFDKSVRVGRALNAAGVQREIPDDAEGLVHVANPSAEWPAIMAQTKAGAGPFVRLSIPALPGRGTERVLEPLVTWVQSDPTRNGGSIFVSPTLRLMPGDALLAQHKNGSVVRILVPPSFGTVAQRKARAAAAKPATPPEPPNRFSKLMDDD